LSVYPWPPEKQIAETTTAPRLRVQVAYAESILARDAVAEEKFRIALATAQAEWPFYVARMTQSRARYVRQRVRSTPSGYCGTRSGPAGNCGPRARRSGTVIPEPGTVLRFHGRRSNPPR